MNMNGNKLLVHADKNIHLNDFISTKNVLFFFSLFFFKGTFTFGISHLSQFDNSPTYLHFLNGDVLKDYSQQKKYFLR